MYADASTIATSATIDGPDVSGLIDADENDQLAGETRQARQSERGERRDAQRAGQARVRANPDRPDAAATRVSSRSSTKPSSRKSAAEKSPCATM